MESDEFRTDAPAEEGVRETGVMPSEEARFESGDHSCPSVRLPEGADGVSRMMSEPIILDDFIPLRCVGSVSSIMTCIEGRCLFERIGPMIGPVWM